MEFLAYLTKGLKPVAEQEITDKVPEADISRFSEKYIIFEASKENIEKILRLKTVDDVHLLLDFQKLGERPDTKALLSKFSFDKIENAESTLESFRGTGRSFSLTKSRYRNDAVNLDRLEEEFSRKVEEATGRKFSEKKSSKFDLKLHFEEKKFLVSVRLDEKPLYFRDYWKEGRKGSLKTSIAASLCQEADLSEDEKVVDNFCGAGTILCEAALQGASVSGGDISREAVECTHKNLENIDSRATNRIKRRDATSTDQPETSFDAAISNLPWGHQVEIDAVNLYSKAIQEYSRMLKGDGRIVILGNHPELAEKHIKKNFPGHEIESLQLGFLGQTPTVTVARPE